MSATPPKAILAGVSPADFVGRDADLERLTGRATSGQPAGIKVLSAPGVGATELLQQCFDELFRSRGRVIPFYFAFRRADLTAVAAAKRLAQNTAGQLQAFRRRDAQLIKFPLRGDEFIGSITDGPSATYGDFCDTAEKLLTAAFRTTVDAPAVFFLDHLDEIELLEDGRSFITKLVDIAESSGATVFYSSLRRSGIGPDRADAIGLEPLDFRTAAELVERRAALQNVELGAHTRDLIAAESKGRPLFIDAVVGRAARDAANLKSFPEASLVLINEIFGGVLSRRFGSLIEQASQSSARRTSIIRNLNDLRDGNPAVMSVGRWNEGSARELSEAVTELRLLNKNELLNFSNDRITLAAETPALQDFIAGQARLELRRESRALAVSSLLSETLKRAPKSTSAQYRRDASLGLYDIISSFNGQAVPAALLDYTLFAAQLKGRPDHEIFAQASASSDQVCLPYVAQTLFAEDLYRAFAGVTERERCVAGRGFSNRAYTDADEIVWLAAEVDSKLEADKTTAAAWCDRLAQLAEDCNFAQYRAWLIAPEGFSLDALALLAQRNAVGSSRQQAELLKRFLSGDCVAASDPPAEEYELILPMAGDAEIIAAHTLEEIAKRREIDAKTINQIKTALVEACINAAEHGLSPDRKIYQKFAVDAEKVTITIANRGIRMPATPMDEQRKEQRRGWGLALMRKLMDDVVIEDTEGGTVISMSKRIAKEKGEAS